MYLRMKERKKMLIVNGDQLLKMLDNNRDFTDFTRNILEAYVKGCKLDTKVLKEFLEKEMSHNKK